LIDSKLQLLLLQEGPLKIILALKVVKNRLDNNHPANEALNPYNTLGVNPTRLFSQKNEDFIHFFAVKLECL
jgi:hypothetical protein